MFAGICSATFTQTPKETLKTKLIHDRLSPNPRYGNFFHGVYTIIKESGFSGVYKGYPAVLMKDASNQGIRFMIFSDVTKKL